MRHTLLLAAAAALFLGCERSAPAAETPAADPVSSDIVEAMPATVTTARAPDEVLRLDVRALLQATAEQNGEVYGIQRDDVEQPWRTIDGGAVDPEAVQRWLGLFTPLEADDRYPDLAPDAVLSDVTHRLVFRFNDGSGRTLAVQQRGDGLAVVSRPNGAVFRLPADRLDALVPPPEAFRAE
jgi:hypothetical protein